MEKEKIQKLGQQILQCYNSAQELQEESFKLKESEEIFSIVSGHLLQATKELSEMNKEV